MLVDLQTQAPGQQFTEVLASIRGNIVSLTAVLLARVRSSKNNTQNEMQDGYFECNRAVVVAQR